MIRVSFKRTFIIFLILSAISMPAYALVVSGHVTDIYSQPVANVQVRLYYVFNGNPMEIYRDTTDTNGDYYFASVNANTYDFAFRPRSSSRLVAEYLTGVVVNSDLVLNQTLQPGVYLSGTVVDEGGNPIQDVDLNVYDHLTGFKYYTPGDNTDANGFYEIVVPINILRITFRYRGIMSNPRYVPVELINVNITGDTVIDQTLVNGFFISGLVRDPNNAPVIDADLDADNSTTGIAVYTPDDNTDLTGHYSLLVPPGNYDINVAPLPATRLVPGIVYNYPVLGDVTLNFNLQLGNLFSGTVKNPNNAGVFNVNIDVQDSLTGLDIFTAWDKTDSNGAYLMVVPTGIYNIDYKPPVAVPYLAGYRQNGYHINGDAALNVTVAFGVLLSGTVHKASGPAVYRADIDAIDISSRVSVPLTGDHTDSLGAYATVVVPGDYNIEFEPLRSDCLAARVFVNQIINSDTQLSAVLDTGMVVSGTITQNGSPINNMKVSAFESVSGQEAFTPGNKSNISGFYEILVKPLTYDLVFSPDSTSGLPDTITMPDFNVNTNKTINILYGMANFSASPLSGQTPLQVNFTDLSSNNPTSWYWDFGDGGTSTQRNPSHSYTIAGFYTVNLTVSNGTGYDAQTKRNYINAWQNTAPVANFNGAPLSGAAPLSVTFTDLSVNNPTSWSWNFGDGGTSNVQNPVHVYSNSGFFTVTLTATNSYGSDDEIKLNYINVWEAAVPVADFSAAPLSGPIPMLVTFTDISTNNPTSWSWNFGDGGTSSLKNPMHIYHDTGYFTVSLTVSNPYGNDTETKVDYIHTVGAFPVANFVGSPRNGTPPLQVNFYDLSQNLPTSWQWDFGDGGTSNLQDPVHVFQDLGFFTVSLTVNNQYGSDDTVMVNYIFLSESGGCGPYIVGDFNGNGVFNVADIISAYSKLKTGAPDAFLLCECPSGSGEVWAVAFDVNNSCNFNVADVISGYSKLKIGSPELFPCQLCPPGAPSPSPRIGNQPSIEIPADVKARVKKNSGRR